jgi:hypothetical protein
MTESRRLVYDSLEFRHRGRIPRDLWFLPWAELHHKDALSRIRSAFPPDIVSAPEFFKEPPLRTGEPYAAGRYVDEWGCVFDGIEEGIIGEVKEPLFADWGGFDALRIPRERLSVDREAVGRFCSASERFVLAPTGARPFERAQFLRGTENLYLDFYEHPGEVRSLLDSLHRHYLEEMEIWSRTDVDGLFMMDDWGSQGSLLIDPSLWREVFKPLYADYAAIAHSAGKKIFMHSDGHILSILEDLIEIGVDALNPRCSAWDWIPCQALGGGLPSGAR